MKHCILMYNLIRVREFLREIAVDYDGYGFILCHFEDLFEMYSFQLVFSVQRVVKNQTYCLKWSCCEFTDSSIHHESLVFARLTAGFRLCWPKLAYNAAIVSRD